MSYHLQVLKQEFQKRTEKNSRFSLRSYAAKLEVHPSALSRILAGKHEISQRAGMQIAQKLALSTDDTRRFLRSIVIARKEREFEKIESYLRKISAEPPLE